MPEFKVELKTTIVAKDFDQAVALFREHLVGARAINSAIDSITFTDAHDVTPEIDVDALKYRLRHRMDGLDRGETYEAMLALYEHIEPARWINSFFIPDSSPWARELAKMNAALEQIDPRYVLIQMKLKFDQLRVYVTSTKGPDVISRLQDVAETYEDASTSWPEL